MPNQTINNVRYNPEFVITVIIITEFDCSQIWSQSGKDENDEKCCTIKLGYNDHG